MPKYLRKPTSEDVVNIQQKHNNVHGFSRMLGSIDCMHWEWKNCPVSWQGQYGMGDKKYPTIMLEAVASQDLWIWRAFYGIAGANNDINVLDNSPLLDDLLDDLAHVVPYVDSGFELTGFLDADYAECNDTFKSTSGGAHFLGGVFGISGKLNVSQMIFQDTLIDFFKQFYGSAWQLIKDRPTVVSHGVIRQL
nr:hypothetical protein [Tanacetum cinerariifolium]